MPANLIYNQCPPFTASANNGTLKQFKESQGGPGYPNFLSFQQTYSYDNLNRVSSVTDAGTTGGYGRTFDYDAYGNMSLSASSGINPSPLTPYSGGGMNPFSSNNRLVSGGYDNAGNQTGLGALQIAYDAESHRTSVQDGVNAVVSYA